MQFRITISLTEIILTFTILSFVGATLYTYGVTVGIDTRDSQIEKFFVPTMQVLPQTFGPSKKEQWLRLPVPVKNGSKHRVMVA